jgi:hypothetical protein
MIKYHRRWVEPERYLQRWLDPRLDSIRVADVAAYLRRQGWKQVTPPDRPDTLVFQEPAGSEEEPLYQFVPDSEALPDYRRRMVELITLLAFYEDRYAPELIDDILGQRTDGEPNGAVRAHNDKMSGTATG